jgi:hypothetical protein
MMDATHEMEHRQQMGGAATKQPLDDLLTYLTDYARERPDVVAIWCFGIGFVLGWKLKPW